MSFSPKRRQRDVTGSRNAGSFKTCYGGDHVALHGGFPKAQEPRYAKNVILDFLCRYVEQLCFEDSNSATSLLFRSAGELPLTKRLRKMATRSFARKAIQIVLGVAIIRSKFEKAIDSRVRFEELVERVIIQPAGFDARALSADPCDGRGNRKSSPSYALTQPMSISSE